MRRALLGVIVPQNPPKIPNTKLLGRGSSPSILLIQTLECCQKSCDTNDSWIKLVTATHASEISMISHSKVIELNILQKKGKILRCNSIMISFFQTYSDNLDLFVHANEAMKGALARLDKGVLLGTTPYDDHIV